MLMHNKIKAIKEKYLARMGLNGSLVRLNAAFESATSKIILDYPSSLLNFANQPDYKTETKNHLFKKQHTNLAIACK